MKTKICFVMLLSISLLMACGKEAKVEQPAVTASAPTSGSSNYSACTSIQDYELGLKNGQRVTTPCEVVKTNLKKCVGEYSKESWTNCFGERSLPDDEYYIGGYLDGKANGKGEYLSKDGSRYVGDYANGLRNGEGKEYSTTGEILKSGKWINGIYASNGENSEVKNAEVKANAPIQEQERKLAESPPSSENSLGTFCAECYAIAGYFILGDPSIDPRRLSVWAFKTKLASKKYISEDSFNAYAAKELDKYNSFNNQAEFDIYLKMKIKNCTQIFGKW